MKTQKIEMRFRAGEGRQSNRNDFSFFSDFNHDSDLAILKLSSPLTFNAHVGPACLPPSQDFYPENDEENINGVVSGWGEMNCNFSFFSLSMPTGFWNFDL